MRFTVAIIMQKAFELLDDASLYEHYADEEAISGYTLGTRGKLKRDILCVWDNSSGTRPYATCGAQHCVYIASRGETIGKLPKCDAARSLVVLPQSLPLKQLMRAIEYSFSYYSNWSNELLDIVHRDGDWDELLEAGHRIFQNPMIIYNRSMRILAYTVQDGTEDSIWTDTVAAGAVRVETDQKSEDLMRFLHEVDERNAPFQFQGTGMTDPFWCAPVVVGGRHLGMVDVVEYHRPLSRGTQSLLQYYSEFVAIRMHRADYEAPVSDAVHRQFIRDLVSGSITSPDQLRTRLIAAELHPQSFFRFVIIHSSLPFLSQAQWLSYYDRLNALALSGMGCLLGQEQTHIGFLMTGASVENLNRYRNIIDQFCGMNSLRAGISEVYSDLLETPRYYRQSQIALDLMGGISCDYENVRYIRMIRYLRQHPYREDLLHPAILKLRAIDRAEGSVYIKTLRTLIKKQFNYMETAQELDIHRTTLAYRLRRINELTGLDLSDDRQMFHVAVSLRMM